MAAVIGYVQGYNKSGNPKAGRASRLGHSMVIARAQTYRTFVTVTVYKDGVTEITVKRDGNLVHEFCLPDAEGGI